MAAVRVGFLLAIVVLRSTIAQSHTASNCAPAAIARLAPAERLDRLDSFRDQLTISDRRRLDRVLTRSADGGIAKCGLGEGSRASCEAAAYLPALRSTGLMPRFLGTICPKRR